MKSNTTLALLASAVMLGAIPMAQAQTIYRIVGADGKVTFSDKPPLTAEQGKVATTGTGATAASGGNLPFELRQVVGKYPVTLYTSAECAPCGAGRALLTSRGIPFSERTVTTAEDAASLQRLTGENSLPVVTIGGQRIRGFSDVEWTQTLDAAGYPKTSVLAASYRNAPASPLVSVQKPTEAKAETKPAEPAPAPAQEQPLGPTPSNPAGISF
jgi:glutaredoxin